MTKLILSSEMAGLLIAGCAALVIFAILVWFKYIEHKQRCQEEVHNVRLVTLQLGKALGDLKECQKCYNELVEASTRKDADNRQLRECAEKLVEENRALTKLRDEYEWYRATLSAGYPHVSKQLENVARIKMVPAGEEPAASAAQG